MVPNARQTKYMPLSPKFSLSNALRSSPRKFKKENESGIIAPEREGKENKAGKH